MDTGEFMELARPIVERRGARARLSVQDREDLLQDVLVAYLGNAAAQAHPKPEAWIETTTRNLLIDKYRAEQRRPQRANEPDLDDIIDWVLENGAPQRGPSQAVVRNHLITDILSLVDGTDGDLLRRRYLDGESAADLAEELRITVGAVDQRTTRAKARLRDALGGRADLVAELHAAHPRVY